MKWTVFDLEFTELLPPIGEPWAPTLHITCGAIYSTGDQWPQVWFERPVSDVDSIPGDFMSEKTVEAFVETLLALARNGYTLVTWGGASSDWKMLYRECPKLGTTIKSLALHSIDIPMCSAMSMGTMMGLNACCKALGLQLKDSDASAKVPELWASLAKRNDILQHVSNDAFATMAILGHIIQNRSLPWITLKGTYKVWQHIHLISVRECLQKHLPSVPFIIQPHQNPKIMARWLIVDIESH